MDNEFLLIDRLDVIRKTILKYGEDNFVISFSGGKDSAVLHYLVDMALPNNNIPRVFINTGIEYELIVKYFDSLKSKDKRFVAIKPTYPLGITLKKYGYPFKSKEHSQYVHSYQTSGITKSVNRYINPPIERRRFGCPKKLLYQFNEQFQIKISSECCNKLKKEPFNKWQKENNKRIKLTGERIEEGGLRSSHGDCLSIDKEGNLKKFKPLNPMKSEWIDWFVGKYQLPLCELYYPPYNFNRSGCVGCPYNRNIKDTLDVLNDKLPNEYRKATLLWKPVYDEYIRIGYRLKKYPKKEKQLTIFEIED